MYIKIKYFINYVSLDSLDSIDIPLSTQFYEAILIIFK